ncbi:sensor histidine kinase [Microlunatus antarcticus]
MRVRRGRVPVLPAPAPRAATHRTWRGNATTALIGGLFVALLVVGGALALEGPDAGPAEVLPVLGTAALYLAAGLLAWDRRPHNRIGVLLLLTGLSIWLTALAGAPTRFLSTTALVAGSMPLALTLHLILAYPSGRVEGRLARVLVGLGYLASTVLQVPVVLVGNGPAAVWDPPSAADVVTWASWVQTTVGVSSVLGAAVLVAVRVVAADPLERRRLGPMVWYRVLLPLAIAVGALGTQLADDRLATGLSEVQFLGVLGLPVVFGVGLLLGSFGRSGEVDELVARIGSTTPAPGELTAAVALALGDPEAVVVYARTDVDGYVDEAGLPVPSRPARGRRVHPVAYNGRTVGGILHREDLDGDPSAMEVLGGVVAMGIDAQRLAAQQLALLADLHARESDLLASRRRLLQAEDTERRRISRDLHDGAQQHIVLLGLNARRLSRSAADPAVAATAAGIADGMTGLLNEFRDLVAGIMPAALQDRGLVPAVQLLAERMPLPTTVEADALPGRLPAEVESTLYFAVSEALTNVVKHAEATAVRVGLDRAAVGDAARLVVTVTDDGVGGADLAAGSGLRGLVDRVAAIGGTLALDAGPGGGTVVRIEVPCA